MDCVYVYVRTDEHKRKGYIKSIHFVLRAGRKWRSRR